MTDLDRELALALGADEDEARIAEGRRIVKARMDAELRQPVSLRRRSRRRRAWLVPAVAAFVVVGGGAAIAQTTGLADRLLETVESEPAGRIDALEDPSAPGMTDEELEAIFDQGRMREAVGDRVPGDDGVVGATVVDDRGGLRVSLVRTERDQVCMVLAEGGPSAWSSSSTACIGFPSGWPVSEGSSTPHSGTTAYYGVLANGVDSVRFHLAGGDVIEPIVANGTYLYWPRERVEPTAIDAVLVDGTVIRRDLTVEARSFAEFVARRRMASRCAEGSFATVAEHNRKIDACNRKHMLDDARFEPAKPFVVTDP